MLATFAMSGKILAVNLKGLKGVMSFVFGYKWEDAQDVYLVHSEPVINLFHKVCWS